MNFLGFALVYGDRYPIIRLLAKLIVIGLFYSLGVDFFCKFILGGDRAPASIFLPKGTSPDIKQSLDLLSRGQNRFAIYGNGKDSLKCYEITFNSDTVFAYLDIRAARDNLNTKYAVNLCDDYKDVGHSIPSLIDHWIGSAVRSFEQMLEQKILGRSQLYWEIFGSHSGQVSQNVTHLTINGVMVTHSSKRYVAFAIVIDELLIKLLTNYHYNLYIRFIKGILLNPEDSSISINSNKGVKSLFVNLSSTICSDASVRDWQNLQTRELVKFYETIKEFRVETPQDEFTDHFLKQEQFPDWYLSFQEENLLRFKELLLFNTIIRNIKDQAVCLLESGVNINTQLFNGATPLMSACSMGTLPFVNLFITYGADVNMASNKKFTALDIAVTRDDKEIALLLLRAGAESLQSDFRNSVLEKIINLCVEHYCLNFSILKGCVDFLNKELSEFFNYPSETIGYFLNTNHIEEFHYKCIIGLAQDLPQNNE